MNKQCTAVFLLTNAVTKVLLMVSSCYYTWYYIN